MADSDVLSEKSQRRKVRRKRIKAIVLDSDIEQDPFETLKTFLKINAPMVRMDLDIVNYTDIEKSIEQRTIEIHSALAQLQNQASQSLILRFKIAENLIGTSFLIRHI